MNRVGILMIPVGSMETIDSLPVVTRPYHDIFVGFLQAVPDIGLGSVRHSQFDHRAVGFPIGSGHAIRIAGKYRNIPEDEQTQATQNKKCAGIDFAFDVLWYQVHSYLPKWF